VFFSSKRYLFSLEWLRAYSKLGVAQAIVVCCCRGCQGFANEQHQHVVKMVVVDWVMFELSFGNDF
jgi:hypothetical protein